MKVCTFIFFSFIHDMIKAAATDRFRHFDVRTSDGACVTGQTTEVIEDREGEIWIATVNSGLFRWNPVTECLTVYRHVPGDDTSIAQDYISTIYESKDGTIWIGTYSEGLCAFSKQTGCFTHYRKETDGRNCISELYFSFIYNPSRWFFSFW